MKRFDLVVAGKRVENPCFNVSKRFFKILEIEGKTTFFVLLGACARVPGRRAPCLFPVRALPWAQCSHAPVPVLRVRSLLLPKNFIQTVFDVTFDWELRF